MRFRKPVGHFLLTLETLGPQHSTGSSWPLWLYLVLPPLGRGRAVLAWRLAGSVRPRPPLFFWRFSPCFSYVRGQAGCSRANRSGKPFWLKRLRSGYLHKHSNQHPVCAVTTKRHYQQPCFCKRSNRLHSAKVSII